MLEKSLIRFENKSWEIVTDVPNVIVKGKCDVFKSADGRYSVSHVKYIAGPKTREVVAIGYPGCNNIKNNKCYNNQQFLGYVKDIPKLHRHLIEY